MNDDINFVNGGTRKMHFFITLGPNLYVAVHDFVGMQVVQAQQDLASVDLYYLLLERACQAMNEHCQKLQQRKMTLSRGGSISRHSIQENS